MEEPEDSNKSLLDERAKITRKQPTVCLSSRHLGIILAITAITINSVNDALIKLIIGEVGAIEIIFVRNAVILIVSLICFKIKGDSIASIGKREHIILIFSSIFRGLSSFIRCYSYNYISMVDNTSLGFTRLIFVSFLSCIFLKEGLDTFDVLSVIGNITGTLLVCHPLFLFGDFSNSEATSSRPLGLILVIVSSFINAVHNCVLRQVKEVPVSYILILQTAFGFLEGGVVLLTQMDTFVFVTELRTGGILIGIVLIVPIYFAMETWAMQLIYSHEYSIAVTSELVTAFLLQVTIFSVFPSTVEAIGSLIIVFTVILVAAKHPILNKLTCLRAKFNSNSK